MNLLCCSEVSTKNVQCLRLMGIGLAEEDHTTHGEQTICVSLKISRALWMIQDNR
jgi:hypothetical protein